MPGSLKNTAEAWGDEIVEKTEAWLTYNPRVPEFAAYSTLFSPWDQPMDFSEGSLLPQYKAQLHMLPVPAWFPDSYIRSQKANLFLKMLNPRAVNPTEQYGVLDFYKEPDGTITGALKSVAKSAVTLVANQVGAIASTAQGVVNGVKDALGLSSEKDEWVYDPFLENQPYAKIFGMNPTPDLAENIEIVRQAWNIIKSVFNTNNGAGDFLSNMKKALYTAIGEFLGGDSKTPAINSVEELWNRCSKLKNREHSLMETLMTNMVTGNYVQFCKVPYLTHVSTFNSCKGKWKGGIGTPDKKGLRSMVNEFTGLQVGAIERMVWTPSELTNTTPIKVDFRMYNDTLEHLVANFYFMAGFTAGAKATTDTIFMRPPYLYDVEVPGGGRFRFCECTSSFTPVGKMRKLGPPALAALASASPWGGERLKQLDSMMFFPDAWDVDLHFVSRLPDTWNFLSGYLFNPEYKTPMLGSSVHSILGRFMASYSKSLVALESASNAKSASPANGGGGAQ